MCVKWLNIATSKAKQFSAEKNTEFLHIPRGKSYENTKIFKQYSNFIFHWFIYWTWENN